MSRPQCVICIESLTPSRRFTCPFCDFVCCKSCIQRYIISAADDANCMNCHRLFDREILCSQLAQTFVNKELKQHRENVLFERECAMMPATQVYVDQEVKRRENLNLLATLRNEQATLRGKLIELEQTCQNILRQLTPPLGVTDKREFVQRCAQEGCRGFLSSAWKCGICKRYTCAECNAPRGLERDDDHVCNPQDKETMRLIKSDSKKCPGCGHFIFRVEGCDQMWCTMCHTAFSFRTGLKINGHIHNPHFYEFQQRNHAIAREPGDIPCGGLPTYREVTIALRSHPKRAREPGNFKDLEFFTNLHRLTNHIIDVEQARFEAGDMNEETNMDLRIKYMLKEIGTPVFREKLQQREKKMQKKRDISLVLQMFVDTMSDFFRQLVLQKDNFETFRQEMTALIHYMNNVLIKVSERYNCVVPQIDAQHDCSNLRILRHKA